MRDINMYAMFAPRASTGVSAVRGTCVILEMLT